MRVRRIAVVLTTVRGERLAGRTERAAWEGGMRVFIAGVDDEGRSCVVGEVTPSLDGFEAGGITVARLASSESCPPPARPPGRGSLLKCRGDARGGELVVCRVPGGRGDRGASYRQLGFRHGLGGQRRFGVGRRAAPARSRRWCCDQGSRPRLGDSRRRVPDERCRDRHPASRVTRPGIRRMPTIAAGLTARSLCRDVCLGCLLIDVTSGRRGSRRIS